MAKKHIMFDEQELVGGPFRVNLNGITSQRERNE
jgi:hypothetical protein